MSAAILDIVLTADSKEIPTEQPSHVAAALNVTTTGSRNIRFKVKAAIRRHLLTVQSATIDSRSSASVADFFNSFEAHRRPILLSIAALHRVQLPEKVTVDCIQTELQNIYFQGFVLSFLIPILPLVFHMIIRA